MAKVYDPILCMMVEEKATRTVDKALPHVEAAARALKVDPSTLQDAGNNKGWGEVQSKKTGAIVARYNWNSGTLKLTGHDEKPRALDKAIRCMDDKRRDMQAFESITSMANKLGKSDDVLHDFAVIKQTAAGINDKELKAKANRIVNMLADRIRRTK